MIAVCDIAVAADSARIALTEVRLGLVPATISPDVAAKLGEAVAAEVDLMLACAPGAIAMTKKLVHYVLRHDYPHNLIYTVDRLADFWESEEAREGMESFFEKRKPAWHRSGGDR